MEVTKQSLYIGIKELKTNKDSTFLSILFGEIPIKLNDSLIEQIESTNYFKHFELPKELNAKVSNCFSNYYEASFFLLQPRVFIFIEIF